MTRVVLVAVAVARVAVARVAGVARVAAVAVVVAAAFVLAGATAQEETEKLAAIRAELDQRREAIKDLDDEKRSLVEGIGELDESLSRLTEESDAARKRLDDLRAELGELEQRATIDEKALGDARARLEARMRALYVGGEGGAARALLGAEGFEDLALRRRFLQQLTQNDGKLVDDVARTEKAVRDHRERVRQATAEAAFTAKQIEEQRALIAETRTEREGAVDRIASEKSLQQRQAKELEDKTQELASLVAKLIEEGNRRPKLSATRKGILARGKLPFPVDGGVVIRKYGIIVDKDTKAEIVSNGVEIRAESGAPVQAVADGKVAHVGWMRGFGRVVILDHGEGHHTISAHLSKPAVNRGDDVKRGQTIGFVGDTESMNGPMLYFELRENGHPRDPAPYLK